MEPIEDPNVKAIIAALENNKFEWRTVAGIAKEVGRPTSDVLAGLKTLIDKGIVIRSTISSANGEDLYSTRDHYKAFSSPFQKFAAALRNRAS
jgi:predicted transcriptional regulator